MQSTAQPSDLAEAATGSSLGHIMCEGGQLRVRISRASRANPPAVTARSGYGGYGMVGAHNCELEVVGEKVLKKEGRAHLGLGLGFGLGW